MTSLIERELSRTQFKSMVVMVQHVVEKVCKDEAVQISGRNKHNKMFWCMVLRGVLKNLENAVRDCDDE